MQDSASDTAFRSGSVLDDAVKRLTKKPDKEAYDAISEVVDASGPSTKADASAFEPELVETTALLRDGLTPALFASFLQAGPRTAMLVAGLMAHDSQPASAKLFVPLASGSPIALEALAQFCLSSFDLFYAEDEEATRPDPPPSLLVDDAIRCFAQAVKCGAVAFELGRLPSKDDVLEKSICLFATETPSAAQEDGPLCCLHGAATLLLQNLTSTHEGRVTLLGAPAACAIAAQRLAASLTANVAFSEILRASTYSRLAGELASQAAICANASLRDVPSELARILAETMGICAPLRALACSLRSPLFADTSVDFPMSVVIDALGGLGSATPEGLTATLGSGPETAAPLLVALMALGHHVPAQGGRTEKMALQSVIQLCLAALQFPGKAHLVAGYARPPTQSEMAGRTAHGAIVFTQQMHNAASAAALAAGWALRPLPSSPFICVADGHAASLGKVLSSSSHSHACVHTNVPNPTEFAGRCDGCGVERMRGDPQLLQCTGC